VIWIDATASRRSSTLTSRRKLASEEEPSCMTRLPPAPEAAPERWEVRAGECCVA
jgi:hypothetical protein